MSHLQDRTKHQPIVWRCFNPECFERGAKVFDFERDAPKCPKCGAEAPFITARALIHVLIRDENGPIPGEHGKRYRVACDAKRDYLATLTNEEAATGNPSAANCPGCLHVVKDALIITGQPL